MLPEDFPGDTPEKQVFHWKQWLVDIKKRVPDMDADTRRELRETLEDRQTRTRLPDEAIAVLAELRDFEHGLGKYAQ
jgi:hypothetical protein